MERYLFLRIVAAVLLVVGVGIGGFALIGFILVCVLVNTNSGQVSNLMGLSVPLILAATAVACIHGVLIAAAGQLIALFVDMSNSLLRIEQSSNELVATAKVRAPAGLVAA